MAARRKTARPAPARATARAARPAARTAPARTPTRRDLAAARAGRRAALALAGTGVAWALATWAGGALGWPQRWRALLDLAALAGFGLALWMTYGVWRLRRAHPTADAE